jgi:hypothetical protein
VASNPSGSGLGLVSASGTNLVLTGVLILL